MMLLQRIVFLFTNGIYCLGWQKRFFSLTNSALFFHLFGLAEFPVIHLIGLTAAF